MKFRTPKREPLSIEFSLKSVMSLMVALIPIVLISSEFSKISIIETTAGTRGVSEELSKDTATHVSTIPVVIITDSIISIINNSKVTHSFNYQRIIGASPYSEDHFIVKNENKNLPLSIKMETLLQQIKSERANTIILSSDPSAAYATLIEIMDSAKRAGFSDISISRIRS